MARFDSEQKARILDAAVRVFAERGMKGATTRLVARAAGVNSALLYYYFESKPALFAEAIRLVVRGLLSHLRARPHRFSGAADRLGFLVNGIFDYYTAYPDRMRLMTRAFTAHTDMFAEALASALQGQPLLPLLVLEDGMKKGEIRRVPPLHAWWSILSLCLFSLHAGEIMHHLKSRIRRFPAWDSAERRKQVVDLLVRGLANPPRRDSRQERKDAR